TPPHQPTAPPPHRLAATRNTIPARCRRDVNASPIATAVVTCPDVGGTESNARHSADSASILAVSSYPGSPPDTSVYTRRPPPSPTKRTENQLRARFSGLGPSPGLSRDDSQLRAAGTCAAAASAATP